MEVSASALELGPKFHINQRVLCIDPERLSVVETGLNCDDLPPLYDAIIKRSSLRSVDLTTREVLPEIKLTLTKKRGRLHPDSHLPQKYGHSYNIEKEWCHLIHFQGWNSRWDRWLTEKDIFQDTEENRLRLSSNTGKFAKVKNMEAKEQKKKNQRQKKSTNEHSLEKHANQNLQRLINACTLPFTLQTILVDDKEKIIKRMYPPLSLTKEEKMKKGFTMLHRLPSKMSIVQVLARFLKAKKLEDLRDFERKQQKKQCAIGCEGSKIMQNESSSQNLCDGIEVNLAAPDQMTSNENEPVTPKVELQPEEISQEKITTKILLKERKKKRKEFVVSIISLIDASLPIFLLYHQERRQYFEILSPNALIEHKGGCLESNQEISEGEQQTKPLKRPSQIYGAEHLLRLFIRLPYLLSNFQCFSEKECISHNSDVSRESLECSALSPEEQSIELAQFLSELIIFLQKNRRECFKEKYYAVFVDG